MISPRLAAWSVVVLCCFVTASCSSWRSGRVATETRTAVRADLELTKKVDAYHRALLELGPNFSAPIATQKWRAFVAAAESAQAALRGSAAPMQVVEELKNLRARIAEFPDDISDDDEEELQAQLFEPEDKLWRELAAVLADQVLVPALDRRSELFERKYFHDPADQGGNLLEGWLNSAIPLFRSDQLADPDSAWSEYANVSPWEGTMRLEPVADLADGSIGMLGTIGVTRHLFPTADSAGDFWSNTVQRLGVRAGIGAIEQQGETVDTILGAGVQIRSISVWLLYNSEADDLTVGLGAADFEWISETLTSFD